MQKRKFDLSDNIVERITNKWNVFDKAEKSVIAPVPRLLMLEVTNACNLKCIICNNTNMKRPKGNMPVELGKKAIREAAKWGVKEVALFTTGEPLLYKNLEQLIIEAKKNKLYCYLTSNGLLLNEQKAEMLCQTELDSIKFSIDSSNKEEYEKIRVNGSFDKLLNNIQLLKKIRDNLNAPLKIICSAIIIAQNQEKIKAFRKLFEPLADSILFSEMSNLGGKISNATLCKREDIKPCRLLWDRIIINYDAKISACCVDFDAELVYADYNTNTLEEVWNNTTIKKWRELHLGGNTKLMPMCGDCNTPFLLEVDKLKGKNL